MYWDKPIVRPQRTEIVVLTIICYMQRWGDSFSEPTKIQNSTVSIIKGFVQVKCFGGIKHPELVIQKAMANLQPCHSPICTIFFQQHIIIVKEFYLLTKSKWQQIRLLCLIIHLNALQCWCRPSFILEGKRHLST